MLVKLSLKNLKGNIKLPYSKSLLHRYLFASYLAGNVDLVNSFSCDNLAEDVSASVTCIKELQSRKEKAYIDCNESATTLRILTFIIAALGVRSTIVLRNSLISRPHDLLFNLLLNHGVRISNHYDSAKFCSFEIEGNLSNGLYEIPGNISSQYISGLLFALPILDGDSEIVVKGKLESEPYVELTLLTLKKFGIEIKRYNNTFKIKGNQLYKYTESCDALLEADWSIAAMWLLANKIFDADIHIENLKNNSIQADSKILEAFSLEDKSDECFSIRNCPDLAPVIALISANRNHKLIIEDAERLKFKESNRVIGIYNILRKLGFKIKLLNDNIIIDGIKGNTLTVDDDIIHCNNDHRMVFMAALASCVCDKPIIIDSPNSVNKSYPNFFEDIVKLGGYVEWILD